MLLQGLCLRLGQPMSKQCAICGAPAERHHIIFRSQFKGLETNWNYKYLCPTHHRGIQSPHRSKQIDIEYKREVQRYLTQTLYKDYYTQLEIIKELNLQANIVKKICKILQMHKEGYKTSDIILRIMGRDYL